MVGREFLPVASGIEIEPVDLLPPCPLRVDVHVPVPAAAPQFPTDLFVFLGSSPPFPTWQITISFKGFLSAPNFPAGMKPNCSPNIGS